MAMVLATKDEGEDGDVTLSPQGPRNIPQRTTCITYYVLTDDLSEGEPEVQVATNLPLVGTSLYKGYVCYRKRARQTAIVWNHPVYGVPCALYEVDVEFSNQIEASGSGGVSATEPLDPTQKRPVIRWHAETIQRQMFFDANWVPVRTPCDEVIYVEKEDVIPVLEITRYEEYPFNPTNFFNYANKTNSTPFYGASAGQAWMAPMEAEEEIINGRPYERVTYRIKFDLIPAPTTIALLKWTGSAWASVVDYGADYSPWDAMPLAEGYLYRTTAGTKPVAGGNVGDKRKFNLNADGTINTSSTPNFLRFQKCGRANFNNLSLGPF